jgi:hypothetical protein
MLGRKCVDSKRVRCIFVFRHYNERKSALPLMVIEDNDFHYTESSTYKLRRKYETKECRFVETVSIESVRRKSQNSVESQTERNPVCFELKTYYY